MIGILRRNFSMHADINIYRPMIGILRRNFSMHADINLPIGAKSQKPKPEVELQCRGRRLKTDMTS